MRRTSHLIAAVAPFRHLLGTLIFCIVCVPRVVESATREQDAWIRADNLARGLNITWLNRGEEDLDGFRIGRGDVRLMGEMGFASARIPLALDLWSDGQEPYTINEEYLVLVDSLVSWLREYRMSIVLSYHKGALSESNWQDEISRVVGLWEQLGSRYSFVDPDSFFIDIYNEPNRLSVSSWSSFASQVVSRLRPTMPDHTFLIEPVMWNHITDFQFAFTPISDSNCIYSFHFYEPFIFTHQGVPLLRQSMSTLGIPYPYDPTRMPPLSASASSSSFARSQYDDYPTLGNEAYVCSKLAGAKRWSETHNVPVHCGEFGVFKAAPTADRIRWMIDVRTALDSLNIQWMHWGWRYQFSLFDSWPSYESLYPGIAEALGIAYTSFDPYSAARIAQGAVSVYPNPARLFFFVRYVPDSSGPLQIGLYDLLGRKIRESSYVPSADQGNEILVDVSGVPSGVYFLRARRGHSTSVHRIAITR